MIPFNNELPTIRENDVVIFMNFRSDRAIQLSKAIIDPTFKNFETVKFNNLFFASIVEYEKGFPQKVLFPKEYIKLPIGRLISDFGLRQLRIAESEKFPHVTYFFNGGVSFKYPLEDRIEIQSPKVPTYDLKPEMSALDILNKTLPLIENDTYNFIAMNLANADMVGHTGNLEAAIKSVQVVDYVTAKLVDYCLARNWTVVITADHGNVEEMINLSSNEIDTEHSQNLVPLIVLNSKFGPTKLDIGSLCDISPTILKLLNIQQPSEMSGISLI
jgi:2,3-bisphosphoglycerate-independent phosphoglycerate mutase